MIAMVGIAASWFLLHTTFCLRYAHLYYVQSLSKETLHEGGLEFPGKKKYATCYAAA